MRNFREAVKKFIQIMADAAAMTEADMMFAIQ